jgi:phosphate uptake regulator
MKRKIVKQGKATMMISLPAKWIRKNNLSKGDEIDLEILDDDIFISADKEKKSRTRAAELRIASLSETSVRALITNTYRKGIDKIRVHYDDPKALGMISKVLKKATIGLEIIKKGKGHCEIENITEPEQSQFDNIFSKVFLIIEELFAAVLDGSGYSMDDIDDSEDRIYQFDNFCRRVLAKDPDDNYGFRIAFHYQLMHAQREMYLMLSYMHSKKKQFRSREFSELVKECFKIFDLLRTAYATKDILLLEKVHEKKRLFEEERARKALDSSIDSFAVHKLLSAARSFYLCASPLSGVLI